ncbi:DUF3343 domain-containing protein [Syntrophomonas erecta]
MQEAELYNYYILFPNHHEGLRAHRKIKAAGLKCTIAPTPREASSSCGISLLINEENIETITTLLEENDIKTNGIARVKKRRSSTYQGC